MIRTPGKHNLYLSLIIFVFAFLLYGNTIQNNYSIDDTES
jgi:hypothetical protein